MLQAEIIYLGGEKETYYKDAANEYIKRLGTFCSFSEKIIKDEKKDVPEKGKKRGRKCGADWLLTEGPIGK